jgi:pyruvate dehydrogenase E2 component (dihydrolipoamide acetyltransferase)
MALREPPAAPPLVAAPAVVSPTPAAPASDGSAMRRAIAATMARSKREIPHYYVATDIDVGRARSWLDAENAKRPVTERLLFAALLLKASARAVREVPEMNGFFLEGAFQPSRGIHLGVAISLRQGGLLAPAIHDVDVKSIAEVQAALNDLVARARTGRLRSSEMSDPTMTITSLGDQGVGTVFGVIYPPQVALVGFGRVAERPWASGGMLGVRPSVTATLSADHRVSDGHRGALYLAAVDRLLQKPEDL